MRCPFCKIELTINEYKTGKSYFCNSLNCGICGEMTRFKLSYDDDNTIIKIILLSNDLQIELDYIRKIATIYRLKACILLDPIELPCILPFNFNDPESIFARARKILVFS
jgi:hypothetical protein